MVWQSSSAPPPVQDVRRRPRGLLVTSLVVLLLAVTVLALAISQVAVGIATPIGQAFTAPVLQTPVEQKMPLLKSSYTIFELTGHQSVSGPLRVKQNSAPTLATSDVVVIGPDGRQTPTHLLSFSESLTRGGDVYTGAVQFVVPVAGTYRVSIKPSEPAQVIVVQSLGSGFSSAGRWVVAVAGGGLLLVLGLILLVISLVRRHRRGAVPVMPAMPVPTPMPVPPGWYPDPFAQAGPGEMRHWDGVQWTGHTQRG